MTHPMVNARLRPMIAPTFAPVIISAAITSVYAVIAPWMPVTVVPTSFATVAIDTFITELSSVIRNCPAASVISTSVAPLARSEGAAAAVVMPAIIPQPPVGPASPRQRGVSKVDDNAGEWFRAAATPDARRLEREHAGLAQRAGCHWHGATDQQA